VSRRPRWQPLADSEHRLETNLGAWFAGERVVYRGYDLFSELADARWMELLLLGITGRRFSDAQVTLFERLWSLSVSYPDPRLWNNRICALAGSARSTAALAAAGATAVTEARIYGGQANFGAIRFITALSRAVNAGSDLRGSVETTLRAQRHIPGYGRPLVAVDERIAPVLNMARSLGCADGEHLNLALQVDTLLREGRWRLAMNVTGLAAALSADQGLNAQEYQMLASLAFSAGFIPCYADSAGRPEGTFFPFSCGRIHYTGPSPRDWD